MQSLEKIFLIDPLTTNDATYRDLLTLKTLSILIKIFKKHEMGVLFFGVLTRNST